MTKKTKGGIVPFEKGSGLDADSDWDIAPDEEGELPDDAFAWIDPDYPDLSDDKNLRRLPHHDKNMKVFLQGLNLAAEELQRKHGDPDIRMADIEFVKRHLEKHYEQFHVRPPWK